MEDRTHLGHIQMAICHILKEGDMLSTDLYNEVRQMCYKYKAEGKAQTRSRIRNAIKSLKNRNIIIESMGIIALKDKKIDFRIF